MGNQKVYDIVTKEGDQVGFKKADLTPIKRDVL